MSGERPWPFLPVRDQSVPRLLGQAGPSSPQPTATEGDSPVEVRGRRRPATTSSAGGSYPPIDGALQSDRISHVVLARVLRYGQVSVASALLSQGSLVFAYGILGWPTTSAVAFSLAVSIVPAYELNRRYVWRVQHRRLRQILLFIATALAGSAVAVLTTSVAVRAGQQAGFGHGALTATVSATALLTIATVWVARYWLFDHVLFRSGDPPTPWRRQQQPHVQASTAEDAERRS